MNKEIDTFVSSNGNETICPYCGEEQDNDAECLPWSDSENEIITCCECGKDYEVSCYVSYSRESHKIEY